MKKEQNVFHSMSELPERDQADHSFSKTVLVYNKHLNITELGYFDFEDECWCHFGMDSFLLKCWCYLPDPTEWIREHPEWPVVKHRGYRDPFII